MLKGSDSGIGDIANFTIHQDSAQKEPDLTIPKLLKSELTSNNLLKTFKNLIPSRQKEIIQYLNHLRLKSAYEKYCQNHQSCSSESTTG